MSLDQKNEVKCVAATFEELPGGEDYRSVIDRLFIIQQALSNIYYDLNILSTIIEGDKTPELQYTPYVISDAGLVGMLHKFQDDIIIVHKKMNAMVYKIAGKE